MVCISYADTVERIQVYGNLLKLKNKYPAHFTDVLQAWSSSEESDTEDEETKQKVLILPLLY